MTIESTTQGAATETAATEAAPATEVKSPEAPAAETAPPEVAPAPAPVYTPNFKFKFAAPGTSKQEEREFDDYLKAAIKDEETEKKIRELHEKAYGLDFVKADRDALKQAYQPLEQEYSKLQQSLTQLGGFVRKKDYDSFFETLQIPREDVLRYALQLVQVQQMSPEQRAQFEAQRAESQRAVALEMQNQELSQRFQQMQVHQRTIELDTALTSPTVAEQIQAYDARAGRPGAFRDLVIQRGQYHYMASGVDLPAGQAVQEVLGMLGLQGQQAAGQAAGVAGVAQPASGGAKPVIPNIQGRGTSPAKRVVKSTDDLRRLANQMG